MVAWAWCMKRKIYAWPVTWLKFILTRLAALDPQRSRIVELPVFAGLTVEETADILKISPATVKRDWAVAKAWLLREIQNPPES